MGLHIHSLVNVPPNVNRDYFIYLLDYGWDEPLGEALMKNYDKMARIAAKSKAVVIRGTEPHFQDEVFSWHSINGENADDILPAILITNKHPDQFRGHYFDSERVINDATYKLILIPLRRFCKSTTDVIVLIDKLFSDIQDEKDLRDFKIAQEMKQGFGKALVDSIILEPNIGGIGFSFKNMLGYLFSKK